MLHDLRRVEQFVKVAEVGSFTGAAAQLHLSQQALSSAVGQLEKELGVRLFVRAGRRITLTVPGQALLVESRPLLAAARTVDAHVRSAAADQHAWVVGHSPALGGAEVYQLVEPAIDAHPDLSFTFRQLYPDELYAAVLDGSVHLGLRRGIAPTGDLSGAVIGYHRVRVAVAGTHHLAAAESIDITDLAGERLALWSPPGFSYFSDFLMSACRRAGFEPDYVVSRVQGAAMIAAPLTTGAVALVTADPGIAMSGRVRVIDLEPGLMVPVQALWQQHTVSAVRDTVLTS